MESLSFFLVAFPAVFTIVNPLGAVGPFLAMTARDTRAKKLSTANRACLIATAVLLGFAAVGSFLFSFFGFTLPAMKIAGGFLLFGVGIDMINARESRSKATAEEREEGVLKADVAIFPVAIPLLSGPGAMVSVLILGQRARSPLDHLSIYFSILATMVISLVILRQAGRLAKLFGATGMNVMARLMGLVLAAIAAQFMLDGLLEALPGLGGKH